MNKAEAIKITKDFRETDLQKDDETDKLIKTIMGWQTSATHLQSLQIWLPH